MTSQTVDAPLDEVWRWHTRPGAVQRLSPPFLPMRAVVEAGSVADGTAELRMGPSWGPLWLAHHQADSYQEGRRFVDVAEVPVLRGMAERVLPWRHEHLFQPLGPDQTRVTDMVTTRVPRAVLARVFAYRHRQLSDDLATHRGMRALRPSPMTVAITGASGTVGRSLSALLTTGGHSVIHLVRHEPGEPVRDGEGMPVISERRWDPARPAPTLLDGVDAVVHLAGASIAGRFTDEHKRRIRESRVGPTRLLAELAAERLFVSASAVGYYGANRDDPVDEHAAPGDDFLAEVVQAWEADAAHARGRVVCVRTGIVQSAAGGALAVQRPLYELGLGGRLGSGRQWMSWIALDDLLDVYARALVDERMVGPVNAVASRAVRQGEWAKTMGRVLRRPTVIPVPAAAPAALLGSDGADLVALASQNVIPTALTRLGHRYRFPDLESALRHELGRAQLT